MSEILNHRDLDAWRIGMDAVEETYRVTADFPDSERYGLISQMRRAAVSVPSNVAEGQAMRSARWALRFLQTAIGSTSELDTQLEVARRLDYVTAERARALQSLVDRERQLLFGLRREKMRQLGLPLATVGLAIIAALWGLR